MRMSYSKLLALTCTIRTSVRSTSFMARLDCCGGAQSHDTTHADKSKPGRGLRVHYSLNGDPLSALSCLATADVLVVARSSFSNVAAALSSGVKLYVPPDAFKHMPSQHSNRHAGSSRGDVSRSGAGASVRGGGSHVRNLDRDAMLTFLTEMTDEAEWVAVRPVKVPSEVDSRANKNAGGKTGGRASTEPAGDCGFGSTQSGRLAGAIPSPTCVVDEEALGRAFRAIAKRKKARVRI